MSKNFVAPILVLCIKLFAKCFEYITWPIYYFTYRPDERLKASSRLRARSVGPTAAGPYRCYSLEASSKLVTTVYPGCLTLDDLFKRAVKLWPDIGVLGTRELLEEFDEVQPNGRTFKKQVYGNYHWETYADVDERVNAFGFGLLALGHEAGKGLLIFAETRAEWMVAAQACFRFNFPLVTLYATLGDEAVVYGVNEAEVSLIITSASLVPKVASLLPKMASVKHVVYMNHGIFGGSECLDESKLALSASSAQIHSLISVEQIGRQPEHQQQWVEPPTADTQAVIMYTSGSTGLPKGVIISHGNLMSGLGGQGRRIDDLGTSDCYIGYLPLAHVLELSVELCAMAVGTRIGYSSPATMTDLSPKIKRGSLGDAAVLKPTMMAAVPVIMDRIYKNVWEKARDGGEVAFQLFSWAYEYKRSRLESGVGSFFLDRFVFQRIRNLLGGRVRMMLCGGAPLSAETQRFMNIVFACPILQGYGLTETCGAGTVATIEDLSTGRCGPPLACLEMMLRDWEEGGYRSSDKPLPRGEVLVGGGNITQGYFKQPEKTKEEFFVDGNGQRWFCTGDIGTFCEDGVLRIIDRKKDLVKLQAGEYVSLGKVEIALSHCIYVESVCVYGDGFRNFMVALVVPKRKAMAQLAEKLGLPTNEEDPQLWYTLCADTQLNAAVLKDMQQVSSKYGLERFEVPQKIFLTPELWTPDTGLVTDAFKLKRKPIQERFQEEIERMYSS